MKHFSLFFALLLFSIFNLKAQENLPCRTAEVQEALYYDHPELFQNSIEQNELLRMHILNQDPQKTASVVYTVPVVVHIIHKENTIYGTNENLSDEKARNGIQQLNDAFRNAGAFTHDEGVDVEIEFCLATQTPEGDYTNGILRAGNNAFTDVNFDNIWTFDRTGGELKPWNPDHYCNIWVVNKAIGGGGFAFFPNSIANVHDGIYISASFFSGDRGKYSVIAHEMGHYLWLYHTFENGCFNDDCTRDGDRVCDTPPDQSTGGVGCNPQNSCTTDLDDPSPNNPFLILGEQPDMSGNFMDYIPRECRTRFSQGQRDRMRATLTGIRGGLLNSSGCVNPNIPAVHFQTPEILVYESNSGEFEGRGYRDLDITMEIGAPPTGDARISFQFGGTAQGDGDDYTILESSELVFRSGERAEQSFKIRIWDNPEPEPLETIEFQFFISGNTNAVRAKFNQSLTVNIHGVSIGILNVYPNPIQDEINLEISAPRQSAVTVQIFDLSGKLVHEVEDYAFRGKKVVNIQGLDHLGKGIHVLRVTQGEYSVSRKFIKNR